MDQLDLDEEDRKANNKLTPVNGDRLRSSRLSRSPFGLGQGTGIVSLLRTNVRQQAQPRLSPPSRRYQFSPNLQSRASSPARSEYKLFSGVNAESTPAVRVSRSAKSEDMGGRRPLWTDLGDVRRFRPGSPSVASRITESPPPSP
jgi:protein SFI1